MATDNLNWGSILGGLAGAGVGYLGSQYAAGQTQQGAQQALSASRPVSVFGPMGSAQFDEGSNSYNLGLPGQLQGIFNQANTLGAGQLSQFGQFDEQGAVNDQMQRFNAMRAPNIATARQRLQSQLLNRGRLGLGVGGGLSGQMYNPETAAQEEAILRNQQSDYQNAVGMASEQRNQTLNRANSLFGAATNAGTGPLALAQTGIQSRVPSGIAALQGQAAADQGSTGQGIATKLGGTVASTIGGLFSGGGGAGGLGDLAGSAASGISKLLGLGGGGAGAAGGTAATTAGYGAWGGAGPAGAGFGAGTPVGTTGAAAGGGTTSGGLFSGAGGAALGAALPLAIAGYGLYSGARKDAEQAAFAAPYLQAAAAANPTTINGVTGLPIQFQGETYLVNPDIKARPNEYSGAGSLAGYNPRTGEYGDITKDGFYTELEWARDKAEREANNDATNIVNRSAVTNPIASRDPNNWNNIALAPKPTVAKSRALLQQIAAAPSGSREQVLAEREWEELMWGDSSAE